MTLSIEPNMIDQFMRIRMNNKKEQFVHPSYLMEKQLMEAITNKDLNKASLLLKNINQDQRPYLAQNPVRSLKNSLICSCTLFTRAIINGGINPETAFNLSDTYILEIEKKVTVAELNDLEHHMLHTFIRMVEEAEELPYSHVINRAINYIHDHILDELMLEDISKECFVSPSYLSHLFKKEVKKSVVQFINEKRVEESKYFLLHTSTSISDIAALFKFCNQSYYTAVFKRHLKITPKQFREKHAIHAMTL
ncbi:helix-turn-helix domain-containing protein [Thalassobacillus pellis]|uniref:helix-turn-helix domain-containing protein n=1 Tax=Thalassobacillus pellis TaxID=748008 RepID=UPI001960D0A9|nr:helix-turn-helix domain-containing protein [Thalassobacillus pellis]MBM7551839.1 AraC-like DNA-binding protein [Thalassobacillus pellis]